MFLKQLDQHLLDLAWSLWTEIGIAGTLRKHANVLILIEELILFTSILGQIDPRLRDEAMDWCSQFHRFISISRLKSLMKDFENLIQEPFSQFSATLNEISNIDWPVFIDMTPLKVNLSHKSCLRPHSSSALLNIRARSIFGASARADLITFFLVYPDLSFSISETTEIGYSKRNLADVLQDLHFAKLFNRFMEGNQQRYRLNKDSPLFQMLKPIPKYIRPWRLVFKMLLSIRACLKRVENNSDSTKVIEISNCLKLLEPILQKLELTPPSFSNDCARYLKSFNQWILDWTASIAEGK